ncbi:hypothetical protein D3C86_1715230 [compost metagenome]
MFIFHIPLKSNCPFLPASIGFLIASIPNPALIKGLIYIITAGSWIFRNLSHHYCKHLSTIVFAICLLSDIYFSWKHDPYGS